MDDQMPSRRSQLRHRDRTAGRPHRRQLSVKRQVVWGRCLSSTRTHRPMVWKRDRSFRALARTLDSRTRNAKRDNESCFFGRSADLRGRTGQRRLRSDDGSGRGEWRRFLNDTEILSFLISYTIWMDLDLSPLAQCRCESKTTNAHTSITIYYFLAALFKAPEARLKPTPYCITVTDRILSPEMAPIRYDKARASVTEITDGSSYECSSYNMFVTLHTVIYRITVRCDRYRIDGRPSTNQSLQEEFNASPALAYVGFGRKPVMGGPARSFFFSCSTRAVVVE
ncbi:hypothetical protein EVAR_95971_1 [Eumeta japonica]|uniref:Uncharacterized protein n=1 Tax=Eumeta variegata TaxID=151549 RepID=A0A4C1V8M9_EUMVA|nr:hypothetical protein EVAR_95971_1 [Eumeta japonica]